MPSSTSKNNKNMTLPSLTSQILPEIDFNILSTGITIKSNDRLSTPRFIPFDQAGRCKECKATEVEVDFIVTKDGVTLYCSRIKGSRFIAFDAAYELPGHCFFRIKNKGRVFNIPHGEMPVPKSIHPNVVPHPTLEDFNKKDNSNIPRLPIPSISQEALDHMLQQQQQQQELEQFYASMNAATMGIPTISHQNLKPVKEESVESDKSILDEFLINPPR